MDQQVAFNQIPGIVLEISQTFLSGLRRVLGDDLIGVYLYGALLFPEANPPQDIDCHVIVSDPLSPQKISEIIEIHHELACLYPGLGAELDAYYILLEQARSTKIPQHQLNPVIYDWSWALHCAHIRAGRVYALWGPEPVDIFPAPTWEAISQALQHELQFVRDNLVYPAYCILNLCRILFSFTEHNPVVSKQSSGQWAIVHFPEWTDLIVAASRFYKGTSLFEDERLLRTQVEPFLRFIEGQLDVLLIAGPGHIGN